MIMYPQELQPFIGRISQMKDIKWAIVGTGHIADSFAKGMQLVPDAVRSAVVSRHDDTAANFARKHGFLSSFSDFSKMLQTEHPDIVYIAVPNDLHFSYVMDALDAGVHVLCEKPMADNLPQLRAMLEKARDQRLFLMEGMWTRCFPAVHQMRQWIASGAIGRVMTVRTFFDINPDRASWQLWKAGLDHAGGALRDIGIYCLAMAMIGFPVPPQKVLSSFISNGEVDIRCDLLLQYADGGTAMLGAAFDRVSDHKAVIIGETGRIELGPEFWHPSSAVLIKNDGSTTTFSEPYEATGFQYEIRRVHDSLNAGQLECQDFTWNESIQICALIDQLRREWNIVYRSDSV